MGFTRTVGIIPLICGVLLCANLPIYSSDHHAEDFAHTDSLHTRTLDIGTESDYPPYSFIDEKGNYAGLNIDLVRKIADLMHLKINIVMKPWSEIRTALETGEIDGIVGMFYSEERSREVDFTPPFTLIHQAIFVRSDGPRFTSADDLAGRRVIVMNKDITHDYLLKHNYTKAIEAVRNDQVALQLLSLGEGDCALAAELPGQYWIKKLKLKNVESSKIHLLESQYCLAVKKGNDELGSHLTEGLALLYQSDELRKLQLKWFGISMGQPEHMVLAFRITFISILAILLTVLLAWYWNRMLKAQVRRRTRELETEIHSRQQAEAALQIRETLYRKLFEESNDAIFIHDMQGKQIDANTRACEMLGYDRDTLLSIPIRDLIQSSQAHKHDLAHQETRGQGHTRFETALVRRNGATVPVEISARLIDPEKGVVQGIVRDISERKLAVEKLRESEARFRAYIENSPTAVFMVNTEGRYVFVNQAASELTGFTKEELLSMSIRELAHPDYAARNAIDFPRLLAEGKLRTESILRHKQRERITVLLDAVVLPGKELMAFCTDISERLELEEKLLIAKQQAESANQAKSEFLANMSHEIRTPMNGIIGMTELALMNDPENEQREFLTVIHSSANALLAIINDILDFSKIESGRMHFEDIPMNPRTLAEDVTSILAIQAHQKKLELLCEIAPAVPVSVMGDPLRTRQILTNLISNAIKFTSSGEVSLSVQVHPVSEGNDTVQLSYIVRDTGVGIAPDKINSIFDSFAQEDCSTSRRYGGSGLGLTISRRLARLMGGDITVESERGKGSVFTYRTGQALISGLPQQNCTTEVCGPLRVCIIDDNHNNCRILSGLLDHWGIANATVTDSLHAVETITQAASSPSPFNVVLLDLHMPDVDGFEVIRGINALNISVQPIVVMLSSAENADTLKRCKQLGVYRHLTKPVKIDELRSILENFANPSQSTTDTERRTLPSEPTSANRSHKLILVVEDNAVNAKIAEKLLQRVGYNVLIAQNGMQAVEICTHQPVDLVLMDISMPEMDGYETTQILRQRLGKALPIIAMTAHAMAGDRERCLEAGMNGYLTKPISGDQVRQTIAAFIDNKGAESVSVTTPPIDIPQLMEFFDDNSQMVTNLIQLFFESLSKQMAALKQSIHGRDRGGVVRNLHMMKGMALNMRASTVAQCIIETEAALKEGDWDAMSRHCEKIAFAAGVARQHLKDTRLG